MRRIINRHNTVLIKAAAGYQTGCCFLFKYFRGVWLEIIANMMYSTLQFKRY